MVLLSIKMEKAQISLFGPKKRCLYDLVVLDLNMPICNGFEACMQIIRMYEGSNVLKMGANIRSKAPRNKLNKIPGNWTLKDKIVTNF